MPAHPPLPHPADFPSLATDTIRYGDTDRQGHVNNAVFTTFLETGRVHLLFDPANRLPRPNTSFVLARLEVDYVAEIHWPGTVQIGSRVLEIGRSSARFAQAIFQDGACTARAETVVVLVDNLTHKSTPWTDAERTLMEGWRGTGR